MAVILGNGEDGTKSMETYYPNTTYYGLTKHVSNLTVTNQDGWGEFRCSGRSVSVWVPNENLFLH